MTEIFLNLYVLKKNFGKKNENKIFFISILPTFDNRVIGCRDERVH